MTEWTLAHHLAIQVQKAFPGYDCDPELLKTDSGNRRPDIVVHQRGKHARNFLVLEVKRNGSARGVKEDLKKIERHWFKKPLSYRYGAAINLKTDHTFELHLLVNESKG